MTLRGDMSRTLIRPERLAGSPSLLNAYNALNIREIIRHCRINLSVDTTNHPSKHTCLLVYIVKGNALYPSILVYKDTGGQGMRERAITSPRTALILLLLRAYGALSAPQLAEHLGIPTRQVHGYLAYLRRRGLVQSNSYTFSLTSYGQAYVNKYYNHLQYVVRERYGLNLAKLGSSKLNLAKRALAYIEGNYDVTGCESIVRFLVEFRVKTGRKYWWAGEGSHIEELAERLGVSSSEIGRCLRKLEAGGVLYLTLDKRRGVVKIRLGRQLDFLFDTGEDAFAPPG